MLAARADDAHSTRTTCRGQTKGLVADQPERLVSARESTRWVARLPTRVRSTPAMVNDKNSTESATSEPVAPKKRGLRIGKATKVAPAVEPATVVEPAAV